METATTKKPLLDLVFETNKDGEVEPVIPMAWTISEALVERLKEQEVQNPQLVILVTSVTEDSYHGEVYENYRTTKAYVSPLTAAPKEYISFSHAGKNVISAFVVDAKNREYLASLLHLRKRPDDVSDIDEIFLAHLQADELEWFTKYEDEDDSDYGFHETLNFDVHPRRFYVIGGTSRTVQVPAELFAKAPPKALKALVTQFFPSYAVDECDFRKRAIVSVLLTIPVQLVGILIRAATLLFGLFMAMRDMTLRSIFTLNPLDFPSNMRYSTSFWLKDSRGKKRSHWLVNLTPPFALIWAVLFVSCSIMVSALQVIFVSERELGWLDLILNGVIGVIVFYVITKTTLTISSKKKRRAIKQWFITKTSRIFGKQEEAGTQQEYEAKQNTLMAQIELAARKSSTIHNPNDVTDSTLRLQFQRVKRAVCKRFVDVRH